MDRTKANQAMLKRLLLSVVVMLFFTYGLVAVYDKVSDEMGSANERITTVSTNNDGNLSILSISPDKPGQITITNKQAH